ncbi:histidine kinase [Streptomyces sp. NPDC086554]|uniref:sensor histidine kinase n=1 Tax=Streptomyces sp. NPDC086554 TaxID=3154864 RepID=UPI0034290901
MLTPRPCQDAFERWYFALLAPVGRTPWTRADLLIVVVLAAEALQNAVTPAPGLARGFPLSTVAGLAVAVACLWRRRAPLAVALLTMPALMLSGCPIPVFVVLYGLAKYQRGRRPVVIGLGCVVYGTLLFLLPGPLSLMDDVLVSTVFVVFPVLFGLGAGAYERSMAALREERERRIAQSRVEERIRLAREMHDILGHRITIMSMHAGAIELAPGAEPEVRQLARSVGDTSRAAMRDLRQVLGALRDGDESVIVGRCPTDLDELVEQARASGIDLAFVSDVSDGSDGSDVSDVAGAIPPEVALTVYRTVQEALTNVVKHAPGAAAEVRVVRLAGAGETGGAGEAIEARIRNGRGRHTRAVPQSPTAARGGGFGVIGLRERVGLLGGEFHAGPTPDGGWEVVMSVPLGVPVPEGCRPGPRRPLTGRGSPSSTVCSPSSTGAVSPSTFKTSKEQQPHDPRACDG